MPFADDGPRTEPPVSLPSPNCAKPAAIAAPVPPQEPDGPAREIVRIAGLAAHRAEAVRHLRRLAATSGSVRAAHAAAAAGPLAEVDLATMIAPASRSFLTKTRRRAESSPRAAASRRRRQIEGVEVVLEHDRDAVQRTADLAGLALGVERPGFARARSGSA